MSGSLKIGREILLVNKLRVVLKNYSLLHIVVLWVTELPKFHEKTPSRSGDNKNFRPAERGGGGWCTLESVKTTTLMVNTFFYKIIYFFVKYP